MRKFDSNIYVDEDDLYCLKLTQVDIILLYAGVVPYIAFRQAPQIPDNELCCTRQNDTNGLILYCPLCHHLAL